MKRRKRTVPVRVALLKALNELPRSETLRQRQTREGACKLRGMLESALHLTLEINDPLQGTEELAMETIEGLLALALKTLDGVEGFRDRGDPPIGPGDLRAPADIRGESSPGV